MILVEMQDKEDEMGLLAAYSLSAQGERKDKYIKNNKIKQESKYLYINAKFQEYFPVTEDKFFDLRNFINKKTFY